MSNPNYSITILIDVAIDTIVNKAGNFHLNFKTARTLKKWISNYTKNSYWLELHAKY
jgi:hypothetical protein